MSCNLESRIAANTRGAALDEHQGRQVLGIQPERAQQLSPSGRLRCGKLNRVVTLVSENESDGMCAEVAHPVKYHNLSRVYHHDRCLPSEFSRRMPEAGLTPVVGTRSQPRCLRRFRGVCAINPPHQGRNAA
jgi:hypothetical protein